MSFIGKAISGVTDLLGITGKVPRGAQSQTGFFPPNIDIDLPLFGTKQTASGGRIASKSTLSGEGNIIAQILQKIADDKAAELKTFTEGGRDDIISREQRLFTEAASPGISRARNILRDDVIAGTGGLFPTPGGQQAIGGFEAEVSADDAARNLLAIDRAEGRQKLLEGEKSATLADLINFKNQPSLSADLALKAAGIAAPGNVASAQIAAQNELDNRNATFKFLNTIFGAFTGTVPGGNTTGGGGGSPIFSGVPTQSQAGGFGMDFRTSSSPFSSNRPQFSGTFSGTSPRSNYFMGQAY